MLGNTLVTLQTGPAAARCRRSTSRSQATSRKSTTWPSSLTACPPGPSSSPPPRGGGDREGRARYSREDLPGDHRPRLRAGRLPGAGIDRRARARRRRGENAARLIRSLFAFYWETDAAMVEINPLITTPTGEVLAPMPRCRSTTTPSSAIRKSSPYGTSTRRTQGDRGLPPCPQLHRAGRNHRLLVNGAGLAMSTMDIIKHFGGAPANFLDVGGGASKEQSSPRSRSSWGSEREGHFREHLRRHHGLQRHRHGIVEAVKEVGLKLPSSFASRATTSPPASGPSPAPASPS